MDRAMYHARVGGRRDDSHSVRGATEPIDDLSAHPRRRGHHDISSQDGTRQGRGEIALLESREVLRHVKWLNVVNSDNCRTSWSTGGDSATEVMDQIKVTSGMGHPGRLDNNPVGPAMCRTSKRQGRVAIELWV